MPHQKRISCFFSSRKEAHFLRHEGERPDVSIIAREAVFRRERILTSIDRHLDIRNIKEIDI